ncbi:hypothetical protein KEM54_005034, partial [Ascosphaera aggregata]
MALYLALRENALSLLSGTGAVGNKDNYRRLAYLSPFLRKEKRAFKAQRQFEHPKRDEADGTLENVSPSPQQVN